MMLQATNSISLHVEPIILPLTCGGHKDEVAHRHRYVGAYILQFTNQACPSTLRNIG